SSIRFVLHTGDVVYLVGSKEQYLENFIKPYRFLLQDDRPPRSIPYDSMVFERPFFPVPGNHDYYDLPLPYGILAQLTKPLRQLLRFPNLDVGWHGSCKGDAYARAFLDYLKTYGSAAKLREHLDRHYTAKIGDRRCLRYQPKQFTRLPNRYYRFSYGGIDFFGLDSSTFNEPLSMLGISDSESRRSYLKQRQSTLQERRNQLLKTLAQFSVSPPDDSDELEDIYVKLEQIEEQELDIEKQLNQSASATVDIDQLEWLKDSLIESWTNSGSRGRVLFFHHPPYVTEATKWYQAQTLAVRHHLRLVLNEVAAATADVRKDRSVVDLVLNGHAHCFEYLETGDTGHADSYIPWVICGGSGFSLRRQRKEGAIISEQAADGTERNIAQSHLYLGRSGRGSDKRRTYSFANVTVKPGSVTQFEIHPVAVEKYHHEWSCYHLDAISPHTVSSDAIARSHKQPTHA
ncbi:MAG: metallophosphoesterase, partial [Cyanobacteria bacterium J06597_1]